MSSFILRALFLCVAFLSPSFGGDLRVQDINVVVEGIPDLLDLECRVWSSQVLSPEVRLTERQIEKRAGALSQNPTTGDCAWVSTYHTEKW
jgi:hypothetical protein